MPLPLEEAEDDAFASTKLHIEVSDEERCIP